MAAGIEDFWNLGITEQFSTTFGGGRIKNPGALPAWVNGGYRYENGAYINAAGDVVGWGQVSNWLQSTEQLNTPTLYDLKMAGLNCYQTSKGMNRIIFSGYTLLPYNDDGSPKLGKGAYSEYWVDYIDLNAPNEFSYSNSSYLANRKTPSGQGGLPEQSSLEMIALISEVGKLSSETAKEAGFIATIGNNGKFYLNWTTGNQYVKVFSVAKGAAYVFFAAGVVVNYVEYSNGEISGWKLAANLTVNTVAIIVGGVPGIILGGGYMLIDQTVGWERMGTPATPPLLGDPNYGGSPFCK